MNILPVDEKTRQFHKIQAYRLFYNQFKSYEEIQEFFSLATIQEAEEMVKQGAWLIDKK